MMHKNAKDISGMVFNRLTVIEYSHSNNNKSVWKCSCSCGNIHYVKSAHLLNGHVQSCGCFNIEERIKRKTTHGETNSRLHRIWSVIKTRCKNKMFPTYRFYGNIGITICKEWDGSFEVFRDWANLNGYKDNLTIDRIDGKSGYSPENCRWISRQTNSYLGQIKSGSRGKSGFKGVHWHKGEGKWIVKIRCHKAKEIGTIHIGYFIDLIEAAKAYNAAAVKYHGKEAYLNTIPDAES